MDEMPDFQVAANTVKIYAEWEIGTNPAALPGKAGTTGRQTGLVP
jgi:hypothetical protein